MLQSKLPTSPWYVLFLQEQIKDIIIIILHPRNSTVQLGRAPSRRTRAEFRQDGGPRCRRSAGVLHVPGGGRPQLLATCRALSAMSNMWSLLMK